MSGQPDLSNDVRMPVDVVSRTVPLRVPSFSFQPLPYYAVYSFPLRA